jgi:hypothetical protein
VRARDFGDDLIRRLLSLMVESVPGALGAGVGLSGRAVAGVGVAVPLDGAQWECGQGPAVDAAAAGGPVVMRDFELSGWPILAQRLAGLELPELSGVHGAVLTAGEWGGEYPVVSSVYLDRPPDAAAVEQIDRLEPLLAEALAVVEYCAGEELRAQQMLQMVQYRRVIEQAKGMLMAALGQDAGTAFAALSRASQHFNVRLRNLAVALVETVGNAPAEAPDDPDQVIQPSDADRRVAAQVWAALSAEQRSG